MSHNTKQSPPPLKRRTLERSEVTRLLAALRDSKSAWRDYFIVRFLLNTGLRVGELCARDVGDVRDREAITFRGKGGRVRTVPLNRRTRTLVVEYLRAKKRNGESIAPDAPLLVSRKRGRLSTQSTQELIDKWARMAGLNGGKVTPHTLRRTFATAIYRERGIMAAKNLLGHSFVSTTQIYIDTAEQENAEAVEGLEF